VSHISFFASTQLAIILLGFTKRNIVSPSRIIGVLKLKVVVFPVTNGANVERTGRFVIQCFITTAGAGIFQNICPFMKLLSKLGY
jgi:hypothetical protein